MVLNTVNWCTKKQSMKTVVKLFIIQVLNEHLAGCSFLSSFFYVSVLHFLKICFLRIFCLLCHFWSSFTGLAVKSEEVLSGKSTSTYLAYEWFLAKMNSAKGKKAARYWKEQVTRVHNNVADGWAGASNPQPPPNSQPLSNTNTQ